MFWSASERMPINGKETTMLKRRNRMLVRVIVFAVIMTAAPLAFGTMGDPGIQLNDACAREGTCSPEFGSICNGRAHRYLKDLI